MTLATIFIQQHWQEAVLLVLLLLSIITLARHFFVDKDLANPGQQGSCRTCCGCPQRSISTSFSTNVINASSTRDEVSERQINHVRNTEKSSLSGQAATDV
jgi:hypothetical protein